ncbi:MAG: hypothetical protein H6658_07620 [Ardenticatenaceae bacterium]|nr:hypothetical protein [Ardenticatenaceae bacterium]
MIDNNPKPMPILTVEIVLLPTEKISEDFAKQLAQRAGKILASRAGGTWVKVYPLPAVYYAENGDVETAVYPIFVSILTASLPNKVTMARQVGELTTAVAQLSSRPPENVHIIYLPEGNGLVAFGGTIVGR